MALTFASPLTRGFSVFLDAFIEKLDPYINEVITSPERVEEIVKKLREEVEYYEAIAKKFEKKYNCSLEELERRIEEEGVPIDNHEIWEDSIEWRNAVEELEKLKKLLEELE